VIRVLVVHEHRLMGDILATVLQDKAGIRVAGYVATLNRAIEFLAAWQCDVIVASITLPDNAALRLARMVSTSNHAIKVLITDMINSKAAILHCIEEGAAGYVYENEPLSTLIEKICALSNGEFPVPPPIAAGLIARINELKRLSDAESKHQLLNRRRHCVELTAREREVLTLMALGSSNQEIAEALVIEVGTVKNHVHNIFRKLDIQSREHATFFARQLA